MKVKKGRATYRIEGLGLRELGLVFFWREDFHMHVDSQGPPPKSAVDGRFYT